jgi:hypothetical protein
MDGLISVGEVSAGIPSVVKVTAKHCLFVLTDRENTPQLERP